MKFRNGEVIFCGGEVGRIAGWDEKEGHYIIQLISHSNLNSINMRTSSLIVYIDGCAKSLGFARNEKLIKLLYNRK